MHGPRAADGTPANLGALTGPRGFTGHEHLDGHGLIHMNGRMYEPALGRFVNADPLVQAPRDAQSGNRYHHAIEMLRFTPAARSETRPLPGPSSAR